MDNLKASFILSLPPNAQQQVMHELVMEDFDVQSAIESMYFQAKMDGDAEGAKQALTWLSELNSTTQLPTEGDREYAGFVKRINAEGYEAAPREDFKNKFRIKDQLYRVFGPDSGMLGLVQAMSPTEKLNVLRWWYIRKQQETSGPRLFTDREIEKLETDIIANMKIHPLVYGQFTNSLTRQGSIEQAIIDAYPVAIAEQETAGDPVKMPQRLAEMQAENALITAEQIAAAAEQEQSEAGAVIREFLEDDWSNLRGGTEKSATAGIGAND
jgi:hypothetical protein